MRSNLIGCIGLFVLTVLVGCASDKNVAVTASPHEEELLTLPQTHRVVPAVVAVEGRSGHPQLNLTPDYKVPELTEEEREALGIAPEMEFLKHDIGYTPPDSTVGTWIGGVATAIDGKSMSTGQIPDTRRTGVLTTSRGGASIHTISYRRFVASVFAARPPSALVGPADTMTVRNDGQEREVAQQRPYMGD